MLKHLTRMASRFFGFPAGGAAVALPPSLTKHENFQSRFLADERTIIVYVPPGYDDEPERRYPQVFGKLSVLSHSVWWDNRAILKMIGNASSRPPLKIWLDMGTSEGGMSLQDAEALRDALEEKGWREGEDLQYSEIEGAIHNEAAWAERVGPFLKYLFPAR